MYAACCTEHTGGESATVTRWNPDEEKLDYLFDLDEVTGDLRDSGRATQCKIHYSFVPDPERDLLYCATHLSGPPKGAAHYNPWAAWTDPRIAFRGAYLVAYDTRRDQIEDVRLMIPREGCRCLAFNPHRRLLYAVTYPRDHFVVHDLDRGTLADYGRVGSINTQCIFLDRQGRGLWTDDRGRFLRFDPDAERIEELPHTYPHAPYQSAWHGVLYDACPDANGESVFCVPWKTHPRLVRFWTEDGPHGRLEDLGPLTQDRDPAWLAGVNTDHVGGLITGADSALYYCRAVWDPLEVRNGRSRDRTAYAVLTRRDPDTGETTDLAELRSDRGGNQHIEWDPLPLPDPGHVSLHPGGDDTSLLAVTEDALLRLSIQEKERILEASQPLPFPTPLRAVGTRDGALWLASPGGAVCRWDPDQEAFESIPAPSPYRHFGESSPSTRAQPTFQETGIIGKTIDHQTSDRRGRRSA